MRYCHLIDGGDAGRVPELFTDDGVQQALALGWSVETNSLP